MLINHNIIKAASSKALTTFCCCFDEGRARHGPSSSNNGDGVILHAAVSRHGISFT